MLAHEVRFRCELDREVQRVRLLNRTFTGKFVENTDWKNFLSPSNHIPQLAIVADNPGIKEIVGSVYLSAEGSAGSVARRFLNLSFGCDAILCGKVIVFNRSTYHTSRTADLRRIIDKKQETPALLDAIQTDQKANGRFVSAVAMTLGIPVLSIGGDQKSSTFSVFRNAFYTELKNYVTPSERVNLFGNELASRFHIAPHFSRSAAFRKWNNPQWDVRIDNFLCRYPWASTDRRNVSWKAIWEHADRHCAAAAARHYLLGVMLGGREDLV